MPSSSSSPPQRPLVVYLLNTSIAADIDKLEFLDDVEKVYGVKCSVLTLEGKSSSDPDIEMARSRNCFDSLKKQIQVMSTYLADHPTPQLNTHFNRTIGKQQV